MQTSCRKLMNYRYILPLNLSFIHSSIHPFIHSYIHPCIHSFIRVFILSFIHSICKPAAGTYISMTQFLYPVIFVSLSIHPPLFIYTFFSYSFIYLFLKKVKKIYKLKYFSDNIILHCYLGYSLVFRWFFCNFIIIIQYMPPFLIKFGTSLFFKEQDFQDLRA